VNCRTLVELVTAYLEGELTAGERARFEAHLAGCPDCPTYLDQMRATVRALAGVDAGDVPACGWCA
jgi:anti-sigma factor RsiW